MIPTDPDLIALMAAGDVSAYGELYRRYRPLARRRALQLLWCRTDVDDLVADAFTDVLRAIARGSRPDNFRAYLLTAIRVKAYVVNAHRHRERVVSLSDDHIEYRALIDRPALHPDPAALCDTDPIRRAFRTLPPRWRIALWLSVVEDRSPAQLAGMLGLSPNAAAALTCRARRGLLRTHTEIQTASQAPTSTRRTRRRIQLTEHARATSVPPAVEDVA